MARNVHQKLEQTQNPIHILRSHDPFAPGLLNSLPEPPHKIVVLRASRIGDFINATPAFRAIKNALPDSHLTVITLPMLHALAERCRYVDRVEHFPGYPGLADQFFDPKQTLRFFEAMQAEQFDLAIQMQGSGVYANPFVLMLGARYTAGFIRPDDPPGRLDAALPIPMTGYEVERVLAITTFLGIPPSGLKPEFAVTQEDRQAADRLLDGSNPPWIGIHPAARDRTRRWPVERFTTAAAELQRRYGGTVVMIGEERDYELADQLLNRSGVPFINLAGKTSLEALLGLVARLSVLITNDTGPAHIGYTLGIPTIVIFGGGDPARNGPLATGPTRVLAHPVPCRPCEYHECPIGYVCLENISIEEVVHAAENILPTAERQRYG